MYFSAVDTRILQRDRSVLADAVIASAVGIFAGVALFPSEVSLVSVFLVAVAQGQTVRALLDRNRAAIFEEGVAPRSANLRLARSLWTAFFGVFITYLLVAGLAPLERVEEWFGRQLVGFAGRGPGDLQFGTFAQLLSHNAGVLAVGFLFALIYRHGGMLLVLGWNASRWGAILGVVSRRGAGDDPLSVLSSIGRTLAVVLPHLCLEALAYVLAAMAGVFLAKALEKHPVRSPVFRSVLGASLGIVALSGVALAAAAAVEAVVAPALVRWMMPAPSAGPSAQQGAAPHEKPASARATIPPRSDPPARQPVRYMPAAPLPAPVAAAPPPAAAGIRLEPRPAAAVVVVDGTVLGPGPTTLPRPAPGHATEVTVHLRGYRSARVTVSEDSPDTVLVTLVREKPASDAPPVRE